MQWAASSAAKKKKSKARRRRSLSGSRRRKLRRSGKKGKGLADWQFPQLRPSTARQHIKEEWICRECSALVLNVNEGGEIACDSCGRWFHLRCLKLHPSFASSMDKYDCSSCVADQCLAPDDREE